MKANLRSSKYSIVKKLGEGGYGKALLVRSKEDKRLYVMKSVKISNLSAKDKRDALREATLLSVLKSPFIVAFAESFEEKGTLYIVMEYADGGDLSQKIERRKRARKYFSEEDILHDFIQVALALKYLHDRKVLHRDLKAQNVFLMKDGSVKLGDFGIAKVLQNTMQLAMSQIGTPYYLSPEICDNKKYNSKTDIWSLGCMLYEMCTFNHPFDAKDIKSLMKRIIQAKYTPIPSRYSQDLQNLLAKMLNKDPKDRPSINQILGLPFIKANLSNFLDHQMLQYEMNHTILHGANIFKNAGQPPQPQPQPSNNNNQKPAAKPAPQQKPPQSQLQKRPSPQMAQKPVPKPQPQQNQQQQKPNTPPNQPQNVQKKNPPQNNQHRPATAAQQKPNQQQQKQGNQQQKAAPQQHKPVQQQQKVVVQQKPQPDKKPSPQPAQQPQKQSHQPQQKPVSQQQQQRSEQQKVVQQQPQKSHQPPQNPGQPLQQQKSQAQMQEIKQQPAIQQQKSQAQLAPNNQPAGPQHIPKVNMVQQKVEQSKPKGAQQQRQPSARGSNNQQNNQPSSRRQNNNLFGNRNHQQQKRDRKKEIEELRRYAQEREAKKQAEEAERLRKLHEEQLAQASKEENERKLKRQKQIEEFKRIAAERDRQKAEQAKRQAEAERLRKEQEEAERKKKQAMLEAERKQQEEFDKSKKEQEE